MSRRAATVATLCAVALAAAIVVSIAGAPSAALKAGRHGEQPPTHFWRTAAQATRIADRQPAVVALRNGGVATIGHATTAGLGLWQVVYAGRGRARVVVDVEDRSGRVLTPSDWSWPSVGTPLDSYKLKIELVLAGLAIAFLAVFFDWRRPLRLANADVVALLAFGASFALEDRGLTLTAVPLAYPPLAYLFGRLIFVGFRGVRRSERLRSPPSERWLVVGLAALVVARIVLNLTLGSTRDVAYASVFGANSIHHGFPIYVPGNNHLDTYGPVTYLAYLPFELLFPMNANWAHDYLPAAHAATISFDLLTIGGLFLLGRQLGHGAGRRRLGLLLAFGWAAYPFTFFSFALNTNDGLVPLLVVYALLALSSPALRGLLLGLAAAAKFAPLALAGLFAAAHGDRRPRTLAIFAAALGAAIFVSVWILLPPEGISLFWRKTIEFQLSRESFLSIWGQQPELSWLQTAIRAATVALAAATLVVPGRRSTVQIIALAGAIVIGMELSLAHWSYFYIVWFAPLAIASLCVAGSFAPGEAPAPAGEPAEPRSPAPSPRAVVGVGAGAG